MLLFSSKIKNISTNKLTGNFKHNKSHKNVVKYWWKEYMKWL